MPPKPAAPPAPATPAPLDDATRAALAQACRPFTNLPGVTGFGFGLRHRSGAATDEPTIIFYVARKFARPEDIILAGGKPIPATIEVAGTSYATDIVEESWVRSTEGAAMTAARRNRQDPVCPGISVGDAFDPGISGTIGAIVRLVRPGRADDRRLAILSNDHVLVHPAAGGQVNQPGRRDDSGAGDPALGEIIDHFIDVDGDAAIASIEDRRVTREIFGIGVAVEAVARVVEGQRLVMSGRTTPRSFGRAIVDGVQQVTIAKGRPGTGGDAGTTLMEVFKIDVEGAMPTDGDSGAAWMLCDAAGEPTTTMVGLQVAIGVSSGLPIACHATRVFERLGIAPATAADVAAANVLHTLATTSPAAAPTPTPAPAPLPPGVPTAADRRRRVRARDGAFLRPTPMRREIRDRLLPLDTIVAVVAEITMPDGIWCQVDLEGDGNTDGFVFGALLEHPPTALAQTPGGGAIDRLTPAMVKAMFPPLAFVRANIDRHLPRVTAGLRRFDLVDRAMVAMALATIRVEAEGFAPVDEGVSSHNTKRQPFDQYDAETRIGRDLGNTRAGDGARFHGRGFVQLTGRFNYSTFGPIVGAPLVDQPQLANDPEIAGRILAAFLDREQHRIRPALARGDEIGLRAARRAVNGGTHGFARFEDAWTRSLQVFA